MTIRIGATTNVTNVTVVANTAHITSAGTSHSAVKDSTVKSVHAGVNLVTGSLNEISAALSGDAAKKFKPHKVVVTCATTDNPAYLLGGSGATAVLGTWTAVADGEFAATIDGVAREFAGIDFSGALSMDDVAGLIQTAVRTVTAATETVTWGTDHFVITSSSTDPAVTAVSVLATVAAPAGTDISGLGGTAFMDGDTGNGIPYGVPAGVTGRITIGTSSGGTQVLSAAGMAALIDMGQTFEILLSGLFPDIAGNATLYVKSTVGDGTALTYLVGVEVQGTQS